MTKVAQPPVTSASDAGSEAAVCVPCPYFRQIVVEQRFEIKKERPLVMRASNSKPNHNRYAPQDAYAGDNHLSPEIMDHRRDRL